MGPTSQEVGAVLGLSSSEIEAMLHELRLKNGGAPLANPSVERRTVLLALGAVAALLLVASIALLRGVFSGGAASAPVASAPVASAPGDSGPATNVAAPSVTDPMSSPVSVGKAAAPVAQNSSEPPPSGLPPQFQSSGEAHAITSGSEVRRAIDSAGRTAEPRRYAVTQ